jgi:hypothetical protein
MHAGRAAALRDPLYTSERTLQLRSTTETTLPEEQSLYMARHNSYLGACRRSKVGTEVHACTHALDG